MPNTDLGPRLEEIGRMVAEDVHADPEGTFLYVEFGDSWVTPAIFKDVGDRIVYRFTSAELDRKLMQLWDAEEPEKRWSSMQYDIKNGEFLVKFGYDDFSKTEDGSLERRKPLVIERFGDKPIDYSDPEPGG